MSGKRVQLMLDSGAFSVWKKKKLPPLDVNAYIRFIHANEEWLWCYVNLDVIPEGLGSERTRQEAGEAAADSYKNLLIMRAAGLKPLPVFHWGEDLRWLKQYLDEGHDFVGVSGSKDNLRLDIQQDWFDRIFEMVGSKVRVHGFGVTTPELLMRYRFFSVDATTWAKSAGYGRILVPRRGADGQPDYLLPPLRVTMTWKEDPKARRYDDLLLDPAKREWVEEYMASLGITELKARYPPGARRALQLHYFLELAKRLPNLTVVHATKMDQEQARQLTKLGANARLLSYFELKDYPANAVRQYVEDGEVVGKRRVKRVNFNDPKFVVSRALTLDRRSRQDEGGIPQDEKAY